MRNGNWIKGFTQKRLLAGKEIVEDIATNNKGNLKGIAAGVEQAGGLVSRPRDASLIGKGLLYGIKNPTKALKEGLEREQVLLKAISTATGKEVSRGSMVKDGLRDMSLSLDNILSDPETRKEMIVNVGGFTGSQVGALTGVPGVGLAGDYVGSRVTRRAFDDKKLLSDVMESLQSTPAYNEANRLEKIGQIFTETKRLKASQADKIKADKYGDVAGWAVGNFAASATESVLPIPLRGAAPGAYAANIGSAIAKISPPKSYTEALAQVLSERIKAGDAKEAALRAKVSDNWNIIKALGAKK